MEEGAEHGWGWAAGWAPRDPHLSFATGNGQTPLMGADRSAGCRVALRGGLLSSGKVGGSGWGSRAGAGAHPCSSQVASPQPSPHAKAAAPHRVPLMEPGSHRGWGWDTWGQGASKEWLLWAPPLPQPLSLSPRKQRGAAVWGDLHPSVPFTPRVCVGTPGLHQRDRGTLFYALKPRYPQPWAALGRDLSSSRQRQAPTHAVLPCSAWGARPCVGLGGQPWVPLPAPGLSRPREAKPSTPVPAAAPAWQHLPSRTTVKG